MPTEHTDIPHWWNRWCLCESSGGSGPEQESGSGLVLFVGQKLNSVVRAAARTLQHAVM